MLNHITVMGRLTRGSELRRTGSGKPVTSFTLACDRDFKNSQTGEKEWIFWTALPGVPPLKPWKGISARVRWLW